MSNFELAEIRNVKLHNNLKKFKRTTDYRFKRSVELKHKKVFWKNFFLKITFLNNYFYSLIYQKRICAKTNSSTETLPCQGVLTNIKHAGYPVT